jgi:hypothetical protein
MKKKDIKDEYEIESRREQYIITIRRKDVLKLHDEEMSLSTEIFDLFEARGDEFHLVHTLGSMDDPTGFVVEISPEGLEELAKKYGDRISIDPDRQN